MIFKKWLEMNVYYHGSPKQFEKFDYSFIGSGNGYLKEGPGFYFTSQDLDSSTYGGNIIKANLKLDKPVPLVGKPKVKEIRWLLRQAPDLEQTLTNWDENPKIAFQMAFKSMIDQPNPHEAFMQVWYDFYKGKETEYLNNMKKLGYNGVIVPKQGGVVHVIMFSPEDIEIIKDNA